MAHANYQNGAVSNQLTDIGRGEGIDWGNSESVDLGLGVPSGFYTP